MCLVTRDFEEYTAEEDIPVWKILGGDNRSPFYPLFVWEEGKEYTSEIVKDSDACIYLVIANGLHSFYNESHALAYGAELFIRGNKGLNIVKMIVPKGAIYYKDKSGELVSDRLFYPKQD